MDKKSKKEKNLKRLQPTKQEEKKAPEGENGAYNDVVKKLGWEMCRMAMYVAELKHTDSSGEPQPSTSKGTSSMMEPNQILHFKQADMYMQEDAVCCDGSGCSCCIFRWFPEMDQFDCDKDLVPNFRKKKSGCIINKTDLRFLPQYFRVMLFEKLMVTPCHCQRCRDTSEGGIFYQGFKCERCKNRIGYVLPMDFLGEKLKWTCVLCQAQIYDKDHVHRYFLDLDKRMSFFDDKPMLKLDWILDYVENAGIHNRHFIVLKGITQTLLKTLELNLFDPLFYLEEVTGDIDLFRTQLMKAARIFSSMLRILLPSSYCDYFTVPERFANALVLLQLVPEIESHNLSCKELDFIIKVLYFRHPSISLIYKPLRPCKAKPGSALLEFESIVVRGIATSLTQDMKHFYNAKIDSQNMQRLFLANGVIVPDFDPPTEPIPAKVVTGATSGKKRK